MIWESLIKGGGKTRKVKGGEGKRKQRGGKGKRKGSGTDRRTDRQMEKNRHEHIQSRFATNSKVTWSES